MPLPIVILSFNRNDYLVATLRSLLAQKGATIKGAQVFLFQDGARNPFSGISHCDQATIDFNLRSFSTLIPSGIAKPSPKNLGIALNFDRAERFVFEELGANAAIFLEDDMVLGSYYLKTLLHMIDLALRDPQIGYVAAYGNHHISPEEQLLKVTSTTIMGHNWGFGLTRRQWSRQKPYVDQYIDIVRDVDYRQRNHDRIIDLFHSWGLGVPGTSQDIAKSHAAILTDAAKVNTLACFGRYIGEKGSHFRPGQFSEMGFGDTFVIDQDTPNVAPPRRDQLAGYIELARKSAMIEEVSKRAPTISNPVPITSGGTEISADDLIQKIRKFGEQGNFRDALQLCESGIRDYSSYRDKSGHPAFLKESFRLALEMEDVDRTRRYADELSLNIADRDPCVHILRGRHYLKVGDVLAAQLEAAKTLQLDPKNKEVISWLDKLKT